jgi:hypothetical protein
VFDWLKNKSSERHEIRDTLFGDTPLSQWSSVPTETMALEPWASFGRAKQFMDSGDNRGAIASLQGVLEMPEVESRHYLQACHFLRELGVDASPERTKFLWGVVVEVGMQEGLDLVAGYTDHHARYYNYSGAGVVWERPDARLDTSIDDLLKCGEVVLHAIGPWNGARPPAPPKGMARINLLAASGLHFGQGPLDSLAKDALGGPVLAAAFRLMQALTALKRA